MTDASYELFQQVVHAVCRLLYGENPANYTIHQRVVASALRHFGVERIIESHLRQLTQIEVSANSQKGE